MGEGNDGDLYYNFGESHKRYLVRILRSNVMVRVGGGWLSLVEFLGKYDPCRGKAKLYHFIVTSSSKVSVSFWDDNQRSFCPTGSFVLVVA